MTASLPCLDFRLGRPKRLKHITMDKMYLMDALIGLQITTCFPQKFLGLGY